MIAPEQGGDLWFLGRVLTVCCSLCKEISEGLRFFTENTTRINLQSRSLRLIAISSKLDCESIEQAVKTRCCSGGGAV